MAKPSTIAAAGARLVASFVADNFLLSSSSRRKFSMLSSVRSTILGSTRMKSSSLMGFKGFFVIRGKIGVSVGLITFLGSDFTFFGILSV